MRDSDVERIPMETLTVIASGAKQSSNRDACWFAKSFGIASVSAAFADGSISRWRRNTLASERALRPAPYPADVTISGLLRSARNDGGRAHRLFHGECHASNPAA